jgi:abnormal spindle-like microcephaly-associated protein
LFRLDASVKSSEAVLKTFCQFLKGEGDIVRHLAKIGYVVTHTQCYIDEFDFSVNNIAVDLRDGVRLCRLVSHSYSTAEQRSNNCILVYCHEFIVKYTL